MIQCPSMITTIIIIIIVLNLSTLVHNKTLDYRIKNEATDTTLIYSANSTTYYSWRFLNTTTMKPIVITVNIPVKLEAASLHVYLSEYDNELVFMKNASDADDWVLTKSSNIYLIRNTVIQQYLCVALNANMSNFEEKATEARCHWKVQDVMLEERIVALVVFVTFGVVIALIILVFGLYYILKRCGSRKEYEEISSDSYSRTNTSRKHSVQESYHH